jgi:hypothetical protein
MRHEAPPAASYVWLTGPVFSSHSTHATTMPSLGILSRRYEARQTAPSGARRQPSLCLNADFMGKRAGVAPILSTDSRQVVTHELDGRADLTRPRLTI